MCYSSIIYKVNMSSTYTCVVGCVIVVYTKLLCSLHTKVCSWMCYSRVYKVTVFSTYKCVVGVGVIVVYTRLLCSLHTSV